MIRRQILFFHADYCKPCGHAKRTLIADVQLECPDQVVLVDVQNDPADLARRHHVSGLPAIALMDNGVKVGLITGKLPTKEELIEFLKGSWT